MYIILPYIRDQAVRKLTNPSLIKCLKSLWEIETPRMPDQSVQAYGPFIFRNSLGNSGETQGVPRRNLIPETRSVHSTDHALFVDFQCRPASQPAWLRWACGRVGRAIGEGQGHLQRYPRPEEEAGVWLILPVSADKHTSLIFASVSSDSRALEKWKWSYPSEKTRTLVRDLQVQGSNDHCNSHSHSEFTSISG